MVEQWAICLRSRATLQVGEEESHSEQWRSIGLCLYITPKHGLFQGLVDFFRSSGSTQFAGYTPRKKRTVPLKNAPYDSF